MIDEESPISNDETVSDDFTPTKNIEIINNNSQKLLSTDIMLQSQSRHEDGLKKNYHGRELLELLQNADDAYTALATGRSDDELETEIVQILFELKEDDGQKILRISNHGKPFNASAVLSLCRGNASNKDALFIGNKGIGFRSVLNWASTVRVYSGKYNIEFSSTIANENLEIIKKKKHIAELLELHPNLKYPILWAPKEISSNVEPGYDTTIELIIKDSSQSDNWTLKKQIDEFDECTLLFIQSTNKITFKLPDTTFSFQKEILECHDGAIRASVYKLDANDRIIGTKKDFIIFKSNDKKLEWGEGDEAKKEYSVPMVIAIPTDFSPLRKKMYTFFPIANVSCPFNALMHTSFVLSDTRDSVNSDAVNEKVFELLLEFYVDKVCNYFQKKEYGNKILELLTPDSSICNKFSFSNPFDKKDGNGKNLFQKYIGMVKEKIKFLTVNDDFIGMENARRSSPQRPILNDSYPSYFTGDEFGSLIKKIDNEAAVDFAKSFLLKYMVVYGFDPKYDYQYKRGELFEKINKLSSTWSASQNIETFLWWMCSFPEKGPLPKLLREKSDSVDIKWIENGLFFLPSRDSFTKIPDFAKCSFLDDEYADKLIAICESKYGPEGDKSEWDEVSFNFSDLSKGAEGKNPHKDFREHEKRVIIQFLQKELHVNNSNYIEIREYSASNLIRPINDAVQRNYENAKEFAKWLRLNLKEVIKNTSWFSPSSEFNVTSTYFPCRDGSVAQIKDLYQGKEYGNDVSEELFSYVGSKKAVAGPEIFWLGEDDSVEEIRDFLEAFLVASKPSIETISHSSLRDFEPEYQRYLNELISEHSKSIKSQNPIVSRELESVNGPEIEGIKQILQSCDTETILKWILSSEELRDAIKENPAGAEIRYKVHTEGQGKPPKAPPIKTFTGYLHFLFKSTPWFACKKGEHKRAPRDYIQLARDRFKNVLNVISENDIRQIQKDISCDEQTLKELLVQLGVAQDFIELPVENFYNMMLDLPAKDPTGELSASVYISCIRSLASNKDILKKFDSDCLARKRFMILGKLSAKQTTNSKEQPSFQPIKEVYFTNKAVPNISGKYLLNVPVKNGSLEDMKLLFGVQQFKEDIQIDATREPVNSRYDKEFQKKLAAYMPYAYCLRVGKASENEKSQFRRLEIHLAKSLYVQTGDAPSQPFTGDAYTIFKKNPTSWYIYIGDLKYDDFELSKKMEDIFEVLCNLQDRDFLTKYRELYSNSERRDSLIEYYGYSQEELNESKQFFKLCDTERNKVIRYLESISFDKIDEAKEKIKEVYLGKTDSAAEQLLLLQFMKFTGIHLKVLKEIVGVELDIQLALKKLLGNAYTNNLHNIFGYHMKEKCKENQDHFLSKWYEVRSNIKEYTGILDESMNPEEFIGERFKEIFGIQLNCEEQVEDISRIYEENFAYIRNNTEKKSDFDDFISAEKYRSRLFYGWESVKDDFDKYLDTLGTQSPEKTGDNPNSTDDYEDEPDLVIPVHSEGDSSGKRDKPSGAVTKKGAANKQRIGDAAELLVFNLLKAHKISKIEEWIGKPFQVKWISGAAARHDQPSADIDDGAGYDMQLIAEDDENDIYYVEVKGTTGSSCEFFMSANELKLAEAESSQNQYRLIFVSNIKQGQKRGINVLNPLEKIFHKDASEYIFSYNA